MANVNPLSMVGLMLTLASLLGSFFYIQLSQWLRDVTALATKIEMAKRGNQEENKKMIRECRIEQTRLSSWHTFVVNATVIAFVLFILWTGLEMIDMAKTDPTYGLIHTAFIVFGLIFAVLSLVLFGHGIYWSIRNARTLAKL